jgi:hypothetical protein
METTVNHILRKTAALGVVLLLGLTACADLDVVNPNAPDAERALATPDDVQSLIAGSFGSWWLGSHHQNGSSAILANASFQMSSWPANFGMFFYSQKPRVGVVNVPTDQFYGEMVGFNWQQAYRAISAVAQGFTALEDPDVAAALDANRLRAFGRFMQGIAHGSIALLYEEGFVVDETTDVTQVSEPVPYTEVMNAALGYLDDAIQIAGGGFQTPIPSAWMSVSVSAADLQRLAHSYKARLRANVARTPAEREAVNWNAVIADVDAGIGHWNMDTGFFLAPFWNFMVGQFTNPAIGWSQVSYYVMGMADQSGMYQDWLSFPPDDKLPQFPDGSPRLIHTDDLRFPQGATEAAQRANPGVRNNPSFGRGGVIVGPLSWGQPARGTYRWSYYRDSGRDFHRDGGRAVPEVTKTEMDMLKAEGLIRTGSPGAAADLINITRVAAGLNATDAAGTNTSCVPKLPNEECGNLLEMMKWEKRMETGFFGVHANSWFFDGRGWGDLYIGTPIHMPLPCLDAELLFLECETTGGTGNRGAAERSSYQYPHES